MRDKKDNATLDLPGFDEAMLPSTDDSAGISQHAPRRTTRARTGAARPQQHQFELLEETDASGLPVWRRDEGLDVTGLPVWAAA
jgi:hypothetical protein